MKFIKERSIFTDNGNIAVKYTCDGADVSPPLAWSDPPEGTKSFALILDDPDAPSKTWVHWLLYNIPGDARALKENLPNHKQLADGSFQGINDFKNYGYDGPCPPGGTHGYRLKLYALDTILALSAGTTKEQLIDAMDGHILEKTELVGTYKRTEPA